MTTVGVLLCVLVGAMVVLSTMTVWVTREVRRPRDPLQPAGEGEREAVPDPDRLRLLVTQAGAFADLAGCGRIARDVGAMVEQAYREGAAAARQERMPR